MNETIKIAILISATCIICGLLLGNGVAVVAGIGAAIVTWLIVDHKRANPKP